MSASELKRAGVLARVVAGLKQVIAELAGWGAG